MFEYFKNRRLKSATARALEDGTLSADEHARLSRMASETGADASQIDAMAIDEFARRSAPVIERVEAALRMTKADLEELFSIADPLGVELNLDDEFEKYWLLGQWDEGAKLELFEMESSALLKPGEKCYFNSQSAWAQMKTVRPRSAAVTSRTRAQTSAREEMTDISTGDLVITNERVVFNGDSRSTVINIPRLVDVTAYTDAIEISKSSGKNDFFRLSHLDSEFATMLLLHFHSKG